MKEILDAPEVKSVKKIFSKLALLFSGMAWLFVFYVTYLFGKATTSDLNGHLSLNQVMIAILFFGLLGLINLIVSLVTKEPMTAYKFFGLVLNILLCVFLLLAFNPIYMWS